MEELQKITSRDNNRLIGARRIRDGHGTGKMFVEGKRLSAEALRSGIEVSECFVSERFVDSHENVALIRSALEASRYTFELPDRVFNSIAATENTQGIVMIAERPVNYLHSIVANLSSEGMLPIVLLLDQVNNPSNLGAVLRTAEAAGASGIIVTKNSTDPFSAKSLRASMGAAFRIPVWHDASLESAIIWARGHSLIPTATVAGSARSYFELDWKQPRLLIFGSEAHGLRDEILSKADERIHIPMENSVESLNLAVAAGIILFEAKRQFC